MPGHICHTLNIWCLLKPWYPNCATENPYPSLFSWNRGFLQLWNIFCLFIAPNKNKDGSSDSWMAKTVHVAFAASLHYQEVRKAHWRESKLVDGVTAFIKERRAFFGTVSSGEVVGYGGDLMCGEEASGEEQLRELKWTETRPISVKRQKSSPHLPSFPWPPNALYPMPVLCCSFHPSRVTELACQGQQTPAPANCWFTTKNVSYVKKSTLIQCLGLLCHSPTPGVEAPCRHLPASCAG